MVQKTIIYFDGACLPVNPGGVATYGYVIKEKDGHTLYQGYGIALEQDGTNNIAEYSSLISALKKAKELGLKDLKIYGDSMLVVNQINGKYRTKAKEMKALHKKAIELLSYFNSWEIEWISRENNQEADSLSKRAFVEYITKKNFERLNGVKYSVVTKNGTYFLDNQVMVKLSPIECSCLYFKQINSLPLLRKEKIIVKCKHILYVEKFKEGRIL